jgi:prepilin-type N-terminal cleavage/methylation domain-containing protein
MSTRSDDRAPRESNRKGFTLIELLIVVVIIGILAAVAIPKFGTTKGKAYAASLKSDLHNLTTAQEAYFYDHTTYTTDLNALRYQISPGVIIDVQEASGLGWVAKATHANANPLTCAIWVGTVAADVTPATREGAVGCSINGSPPPTPPTP